MRRQLFSSAWSLRLRAIALGTVVLFAAPARANLKSQREALTEMAAAIRKVVDKERLAVRVGRFSLVGDGDANTGDGISALLAELLGKNVKEDSPLEITGTYGLFKVHAESEDKVVKIKARIVNKDTGEDIKDFFPFEAAVGSNPDKVRIMNGTVALTPEAGPRQRAREVEDQLKNPRFFIHGTDLTLVSSKPGSPYAVEIRTKPATDHERHVARPRKVQAFRGKEPVSVDRPGQQPGHAFVPIARDELYEVRILNGQKQEAAITLHIDGIDVFAFTDDRDGGRPRYTHFIVPPATDQGPGETTIVGWHKTADPQRKDNFLSFLVAENGKGAAAKFPRQAQGKVGTITVAFALSFPAGTPRTAGAETGFGPPVEVKQKIVERVIDPPHEFVTVRYQR